jgi:hypothetical protein
VPAKDAKVHLGVVLNISEELNAIRKRAKTATLKFHTQESLLARTHSILVVLKVLAVSTNLLPVIVSQALVGQSSTLTKQQILPLIFWKTTSLKELD